MRLVNSKFFVALSVLATCTGVLAACGVGDLTDKGVDDERSTDVRSDGLTERSTVSDDILSRRWPNGVVPYTYQVKSNPEYPDTADYPEWFHNYEMWRDLTGGAVRFVPRVGESPYINIIFDGNNSTRRLRGTKRIVDDSGDLRLKPIAGRWDIHIRPRDPWKVNHELGHVLGLFHQQRHPDSSSCVGLKAGMPQRIPRKYFIGGYSRDSIMHYMECDLSKDDCDYTWWAPASTGCSFRGCRSCPATPDWHDPPSAFDVLAIKKMYGANADYYNDSEWCRGRGHKIYLGDFNGDGLDDLLCHARAEGITPGARFFDFAKDDPDDVYGEGLYGVTSNSFCVANHRGLHVGDFDGDGRDDLLCHDTSDGRRFIDYSELGGVLQGTDFRPPGNFCWGSDRQLYIGDFDGDGKADHLCHNKRLGTRSIDYGRTGFNGMDWISNKAWCKASNRRLLVGDFNGDGRDDLICHDQETGDRWIDYADTSGQLNGSNWSSKYDDRASTFCMGDDNTLYVADVNGDGRDDLVCHNRYLGAIAVDLATSSTTSEGSGLWGMDRYNEHSFCNAQDARLLVGRLPNSASADALFCHNEATGHQMARYSY